MEQQHAIIIVVIIIVVCFLMMSQPAQSYESLSPIREEELRDRISDVRDRIRPVRRPISFWDYPAEYLYDVIGLGLDYRNYWPLRSMGPYWWYPSAFYADTIPAGTYSSSSVYYDSNNPYSVAINYDATRPYRAYPYRTRAYNRYYRDL